MKKGGDARGRVVFKKNLSFFKCVTQCDDSDLWCVIKCFFIFNFDTSQF